VFRLCQFGTRSTNKRETTSVGWTASDIPDLTGKTAVVTGGNAGLGYETVKSLAGCGADVVMASRNEDKARFARESILGDNPDASVSVVSLDLASLDSVESAVQSIISGHEQIDILVNNAGLMALPQQKTDDGFEMQFGVNHLGHWVLTAGLLPAIVRSPGARVVTVTSTAHHMGRGVNPDNPHLASGYGPWKAYGQSKLANYHFAIGLQRLFETHEVDAASLMAHPGLSHTNLQANTVDEGGGGWTAPVWSWLAEKVGMDADAGALPQLRAATDPSAKGGEFYAPLYVNSGAPVRRPILRRFGMDKSIDTLWDVSERETGIGLDVA
jgi:NAD(P)-dependent dehydrogenase (short-subunit alcohol dehydrogenase family)